MAGSTKSVMRVKTGIRPKAVQAALAPVLSRSSLKRVMPGSVVEIPRDNIARLREKDHAGYVRMLSVLVPGR